MAAEQPHKTGFLDLSAELRNKIYEYALIPDEEKVESTIELYNVPQELSEPALLATHSQICAEALPVYYGNNTFEIQACGLSQLAQALGGKRLHMIRRLRVTPVFGFVSIVEEHQWAQIKAFLFVHHMFEMKWMEVWTEAAGWLDLEMVQQRYVFQAYSSNRFLVEREEMARMEELWHWEGMRWEAVTMRK